MQKPVPPTLLKEDKKAKNEEEKVINISLKRQVMNYIRGLIIIRYNYKPMYNTSLHFILSI